MSAVAPAVTGTGENGVGVTRAAGGIASRQWSRRLWVAALLGVWLVSGLYVFSHLSGNWVASDDGMLAQSAERVLHGQMPHRDFAEVYTGGLSYLHAAGFNLFGVRLLSLRYVLFGFVVLWLPVVFYCASRFVAPLGATATTLLSAVWTVPNYPAAMPSWYNLFFATFGAAAFLRYSETHRRRWIFAAGVMGGCSILIKIVGLYYVAACLLYLVVHAADSADPSGRRALAAYRIAVGVGLGLFVIALAWLIHNHLTVVHVYHFLLPGAMLAGLVWHAAARSARPGSIQRLWQVGWPFLLGTAVPLAAFVLPYAFRGALPALVRGVFVSPATRLAASASASLPPAGWLSIVPAIILMLIVLLAVRAGSGGRGRLVAALWIALVGGLLAVGGLDYLDLFSWAAVAEATPLVVAVGVITLWREQPPGPSARAMEQCVLLLALAGVCSLTAFPYSAPIYFCYIAPLPLLALLALFCLTGGSPRPLSGVLAGFFLTLALVALNAQSLRDVGIVMHPALTLVPLRLPRTGIRVRVEDADRYESLIDTLVAHARGGVTYAGPDSPEVYFLAGLRNPTRLIFDFLEPDGRQPDSLLALVDRERMTAVVIRSNPEFSRPLEAQVLQGFAERFPHQWTTGGFTVRWRE